MAQDRIYAVGDIHGQLGKLVKVHEWIERDQSRNGPGQVVHLGDLIDRGPDSKGVIDYLIEGLEAGEDWLVLKGNHDRLMSRFLDDYGNPDPRMRSGISWLHSVMGGWETLQSYGVDMSLAEPDMHAAALDLVPEAHRAFMRELPTSHQTLGLVFAHAGIKPGVPMDQQVEDDLIWIRDEFLFSRKDHGALVIHGHTPVEEVLHYGNRVNVDTGAAYGGPLSAIVIEDGDVFLLGKRGRKLVKPPRR